MNAPRTVFWAALLLTVFVRVPCFGDEPAPAKVARMFYVPPDFLTRGGNGEGRPRYPHIIRSLGSELPLDARPVLKELGIDFQKGEVALIPASPERQSSLFVFVRQDQMDLVETIINQMGGFQPTRELHISYYARETAPNGKARDLLERTVIVRGGQRAAFQRQREGQTVEKAELEATISEDDATVDVNTDLQLQFKDLKVHATGQAFVRDSDAPAVLYTGAGRKRNSKLEVFVSAKILRDQPGETNRGWWPKLAVAAAAEVALAESATPSSQLVTELVGLRLWQELKDAPRSVIELPDGGSAEFFEASETLRSEDGILSGGGGRAWYWPEGRMLFLQAPAKAIAAAQGLVETQRWESSAQYQVKLAAAEKKGEREQAFPPRTLLIRSTSRAKGTSERPGGQEEMEAELTIGAAHTAADVNVALTGAVFGRETWTFTTQALTWVDSTEPLTLISGRAADAGGGFKRLQLTVNQRGDSWQELLRDPARKAALVAALEAALLKK